VSIRGLFRGVRLVMIVATVDHLDLRQYDCAGVAGHRGNGCPLDVSVSAVAVTAVAIVRMCHHLELKL